MKLHSTLVDHLIHLFTTYGGWREESRLKNELTKLEIAVYKQQSTGEEVLVDAAHLEKALRELQAGV